MRKFQPFETSSVLEFKDPDTGLIHRADNYKDLYKNIIAYRDQNGLEPIELLKETVENYLCSLPVNCNKCTTTDLPRGIYTYVKGGLNLFKMMLFKRFATQAVAEKRAQICIKCPHNVFPNKDHFMAWADNIAVASIEERKTPYDKELGSCEICSCVLRSKIFFDGKLDKFKDDEVAKMKNVGCWQLALSGQ